ncbi:Proteophosphoglycan ppg4 [Rhodotorula toruloides ATCC 204091]|uniref:Proteophosphoglycan ppg4 n=1 Tax=Rhodotorula toruloides TaxID=5286 RepID=A0A2S9ZWN2_RHOTO|nr:Proteophosphoglycan ppg4 [Rhodotorula toruloides ATCC 204091]PRQ70162.1 Proteophosphoglycan ppg4 [Rhodotorula toruloides]
MRLPDDSADETECRPEGEVTSGEGKPRSPRWCRGGREMYDGRESPANEGRDGACGDCAGLDAGCEEDPWPDETDAREKGKVLECAGASAPSSSLAALGGAGGLPALRSDEETAGDEGRGGGWDWGESFAMPAGGSVGVVHGYAASACAAASLDAFRSRKLGGEDEALAGRERSLPSPLHLLMPFSEQRSRTTLQYTRLQGWAAADMACEQASAVGSGEIVRRGRVAGFNADPALQVE